MTFILEVLKPSSKQLFSEIGIYNLIFLKNNYNENTTYQNLWDIFQKEK